MQKISRPLLAAATLLAATAQATPALADFADAYRAYRGGDYAAAYREYLRLAERGDVRAQGAVACMKQAGEGVPADPASGLTWYLRAAQGGLGAESEHRIGRAFEAGVGTERDLAQAALWYAKAAQHGSPEGRESEARVKALLAAQEKERVASRENERVAAAAAQAQGRAAAATEAAPPAAPEQTMPELIFENRKIVQKRVAAESGDAEAQVYLGWCYSTGSGVAKDKGQAVRWYRAAAEAGKVNAQVALGWMYYSGEAGQRDLEQSARWYRRAALQGNATGKRMLKRIEQEIRAKPKASARG